MDVIKNNLSPACLSREKDINAEIKPVSVPSAAEPKNILRK